VGRRGARRRRRGPGRRRGGARPRAAGGAGEAARGGAFAAACRLAPLRSLGRYSYCVYLVHFLVIDELAHALHRRAAADPELAGGLAQLPPLVLVLAFTGVCLAASWLIAFASWHLFEKWFLALKRFVPSGGALPPPP
jgi:peptidoglycan/LPS O-acetylase OafA/YrhL